MGAMLLAVCGNVGHKISGEDPGTHGILDNHCQSKSEISVAELGCL